MKPPVIPIPTRSALSAERIAELKRLLARAVQHHGGDAIAIRKYDEGRGEFAMHAVGGGFHSEAEVDTIVAIMESAPALLSAASRLAETEAFARRTLDEEKSAQQFAAGVRWALTEVLKRLAAPRTEVDGG